MAMSNRERQAAYRKRQQERRMNGTEGYRINTITDTASYYRLDRLASNYGVTKRKMIEQVLAWYEFSLTKKMSSEEKKMYFDLDNDE